jgi:hypothetical protein
MPQLTVNERIERSGVEGWETIIVINNMDAAFVGLVLHEDRWVAVYSREKCIEEYIRQGMKDRDEAIEHMDYNYPTGPGYPLIVYDDI